MSSFRLGVIGCGGMARMHMRYATRLPGLQLHAFADANVAAAQKFLQEFGGSYSTADPHQLLRDDALDAVLIATHHDSHAPLALAAAAAGKHALVEKPLAMTREDCLRVEEAVERAGTLLMCGFQRRYAPLVQETKQLIAKPLMLVGQVMDNPWSDTIWAQDPVKGGGNVISQGCHSFDLLTYLAGSEPVQVYATGGTLTHDPEATQIVDNLAGTITFKSGAVASVIQGDAGVPAYVSKWFFEVFDGRTAVQIYDRMHRMTLSGRDHQPPQERSIADEDDPEGLGRQLADFVACAAAGKRPTVGATAADGTLATTVAEALIASVRTGLPRAL